jgi:hypothetical protein
MAKGALALAGLPEAGGELAQWRSGVVKGSQSILNPYRSTGEKRPDESPVKGQAA